MADAAERVFVEGDLVFAFDGSWSVVRKWDDAAAYRALRDEVPGSHGVDFVAVREEPRGVYLIEVKDYRAVEGQKSTRDKLDEDGAPLAVIVAEKVRDTVAGLIGAARGGRDDDWTSARQELDRTIWVVLWAEHAGIQAGPKVRERRESIAAGTLLKTIRRRCRWLHANFLVCSRTGECLPGLRVTSVANAARTRGRG